MPLPREVREQLELLPELVDRLTEWLRRLDRRIRDRVTVIAEAKELLTIPGVGPSGARLILAELGSSTDFPRRRRWRAVRASAEHPELGPQDGAWQCGDGGESLKWIPIEAVKTLNRWPGPVRSQYERLLRAKGKQKAAVAAARKLATDIHWMRREGWTYEQWLAQHQTAKREGARSNRWRPSRTVASRRRAGSLLQIHARVYARRAA